MAKEYNKPKGGKKEIRTAGTDKNAASERNSKGGRSCPGTKGAGNRGRKGDKKDGSNNNYIYRPN